MNRKCDTGDKEKCSHIDLRNHISANHMIPLSPHHTRPLACRATFSLSGNQINHWKKQKHYLTNILSLSIKVGFTILVFRIISQRLFNFLSSGSIWKLDLVFADLDLEGRTEVVASGRFLGLSFYPAFDVESQKEFVWNLCLCTRQK